MTLEARPLGRTDVELERREEILDLAATLQLRRRQVADRLRAGGSVAAEYVGRNMSDIDARLAAQAPRWRECRALLPRISSQQLRRSLALTSAAVAAGLHMVSILDRHGIDAVSVSRLAAEDPGVFRIGVAPIELRLLGREAVLLRGPFVRSRPTVMMVRDQGCLAAAWRYWRACESTSHAPQTAVPTLEDFTPRQRSIVAMLADGSGDSEIANALAVSVRTVRYDIACILRVLGVRSRFAAGLKLHELSAAGSAVAEPAESSVGERGDVQVVPAPAVSR
jgi:DNA-binding CsgD family transcriptional regulator